MQLNEMTIGILLSQKVLFRGVVYWAFAGPTMTHLIDPDDIVELKEVHYHG